MEEPTHGRIENKCVRCGKTFLSARKEPFCSGECRRASKRERHEVP